jgi:MoxR-like ATPase
MEEKQVTIDGKTHPLPQPFFVIATQNPASQIGTFPLPESQLDRFLMCINIGYPDSASERALLEGDDRREMLAAIKPAISPEQLLSLQRKASAVYTSPAILDYCQAILKYTRQESLFKHGLSPRAGLALLNAAKGWALLEGREEVIPEHLQAVIPAVVNHRLMLQQDVSFDDAGKQILEHVAIP